jgi:uncharacterized protein YpuA (DUF1002 family)
MKKVFLTESQIKKVVDSILNESTSKVSRYEFGRVQFKIDELQNSLNETVKELRKLQDSIPNGLQNITKSKISTISSNLTESQKLLMVVKEKIKNYKKSLYTQTIEEKK